MAAGWEVGEALSDALLQFLSCAAEERAEASIESELFAVVAYEVEDGAGCLSLGARRPRPSCWRKRVGLSVGRRRRRVSTTGTSTPSLKRSTEKTNYRTRVSSSTVRLAWRRMARSVPRSSCR